MTPRVSSASIASLNNRATQVKGNGFSLTCLRRYLNFFNDRSWLVKGKRFALTMSTQPALAGARA
jgi:hypothetical protein